MEGALKLVSFHPLPWAPDQVAPSPAQPGLENVTSQKQEGEHPPKITTNPARMEKIKSPCPSCASSAVLLQCPPWPVFRAAAKNTLKREKCLGRCCFGGRKSKRCITVHQPYNKPPSFSLKPASSQISQEYTQHVRKHNK